ncbi:MAG: FISUMP domain-containing protein [Candidatus Saccharibacteria bacterium]
MKSKTNSKQSAFTIVELLVVIVVIGILAAITIVAYTGISKKATEATLQSDLSGASKQLEIFKVTNGAYPETNNCSIAVSTTNICLKPSGTNTLSYTPGTQTNPQTYSLDAVNGTNNYNVTNNSAPTVTVADTSFVTIGTQSWKKTNLNDGTRVNTSSTLLTSTQKWCYDNLESNCTTYGGLYDWNSVITPRNGGTDACGVGFHVPTDIEWSNLSTYLGDATVGTQLKVGGTSGFNGLIAGYSNAASSLHLGLLGNFWSSTAFNATYAKQHELRSDSTLGHYNYLMAYGMSVRCLKN